MAEIKVTGRIKVKSFYKAFSDVFPYLHAILLLPDGTKMDPEYTIAGARYLSNDKNYVPTGEKDFSVNGNLQIGTFEKRFKDVFGINCQIHYKHNGLLIQTRYTDTLTLSSLNESCKKDGGEIFTF
jgi:hypothetical protein